jgi:hypothetical protein
VAHRNGSNPHLRYFIVLVCYLDDSGEKKEPVITIAGYLSFADKWQEFELIARDFFDRIGLQYLHTVDLHNRRDFFKGWDSTQTLQFSKCLFELLGPNVGHGFEFSVLKSQFLAQKKTLKLKREGSPFGFCFKGIIDRILKNEGVKEVLREPGVDLSFVVERGNTNNGDIQAIWDDYVANSGLPLRSLTFEDKKKTIALNVADFLAFFCRRIRNRTTNNMREDDLRFFERAIGGISHRYFLASDFGGESLSALK